MPSFTSASCRTYVPGDCGAVIVAVSWRTVAGGTSAPSGVRGPSHTTVWPARSVQWKLRFTGLAPVAFHTSVPAFWRVTGTWIVPPAGAEAGGLSWEIASKVPAGAERGTTNAERATTRTRNTVIRRPEQITRI